MSYISRYNKILNFLNNSIDTFKSTESEPLEGGNNKLLFSDLEFDEYENTNDNLIGGYELSEIDNKRNTNDLFLPTITNYNITLSSSDEDIINDLNKNTVYKSSETSENSNSDNSSTHSDSSNSLNIERNLTLAELENIYADNDIIDYDLDDYGVDMSDAFGDDMSIEEYNNSNNEDMSEDDYPDEDNKDMSLENEEEYTEDVNDMSLEEYINEDNEDNENNNNNLSGGESMKTILTDLSDEKAYIEGCKATSLSGGHNVYHKTSFNYYPYI